MKDIEIMPSASAAPKTESADAAPIEPVPAKPAPTESASAESAFTESVYAESEQAESAARAESVSTESDLVKAARMGTIRTDEKPKPTTNGPSLLRRAIPDGVLLVLAALIFFWDEIWLGRYCGYIAVSAMIVSLPYILLSLAFGLLFGAGALPLIRARLKKNKRLQARRCMTSAFFMALTSGLVLSAVCSAFIRPLSRLAGADEAILPYAEDFGRLVYLFLFLFELNVVSFFLIRAEGSIRTACAGRITSFLIHLVGTPFLLKTGDLGVWSASLALLAGEIVSALIYVYHMLGPSDLMSFRGAARKRTRGYNFRIMLHGMRSFLLCLALSASLIVMNRIVLYYGAGGSENGAVIPMTAFGVITSLMLVPYALCLCISRAASARIRGIKALYDEPASKESRRAGRRIYVLTTLFLTILLALISLWLYQLPLSVVQLFDCVDPGFNETLGRFLQFGPIALAAAGFSTGIAAYLNAEEHGAYTALLILCRIVLPIPAFLILQYLYGTALLPLTFAAADVITAVLAIIFLIIVYPFGGNSPDSAESPADTYPPEVSEKKKRMEAHKP